jgi:hypothetical protein
VNNKQKSTLNHIFEKPVRTDILWVDIESLFRGLGAKVTEGNGSRVRVALNGVKAVFHRPQPERITDRGMVGSVKRFLENANCIP